MAIVEVQNVSVTLDHRTIVRDITFAVEPGQNVAIVGPNGAGKTVLVKSLLGILPHAGTIRWRDGVTVGYVPQKIEADRSVPLNARALLHAKASVIGASHADVADTVARVGLTNQILSTPLGHLSGGQFQRTLIAFALLGGPDIVFFDEPTASIDEPGEEQIYDLIDRLRHDMNLAVVMITHDHTYVERHASFVVRLP